MLLTNAKVGLDFIQGVVGHKFYIVLIKSTITRAWSWPFEVARYPLDHCCLFDPSRGSCSRQHGSNRFSKYPS